MNNVPGDGTRAADYLQRQRYLLLQDFCRPLKSALTALKRGNGADSSGLRRLGGARVQGRCYERSAYGYWLQFEDAGVGLTVHLVHLGLGLVSCLLLSILSDLVP